MRIISQNREIDANYDISHLGYAYKGDGKHIIGATTYDTGGNNAYLLGVYSSKKRYLEVMNEIRDNYSRGSKVYLMPEE